MSEIDDFYLAEDGLGLAAALRGGCVSASELLEAALARAASINSSLGAALLHRRERCPGSGGAARSGRAIRRGAFLSEGSGRCGRWPPNHRRRPLLCAERPTVASSRGCGARAW